MIHGLLCDGFFDCASVFTKSVAEMTFSLAYILDVTIVALYHIADVISYASLFVGREKSVRFVSLCN